MSTFTDRTPLSQSGTAMNHVGEVAKVPSGRAGLACDECRTRKRRCDNGRPVCGRCLKRTSVCVYSTDHGRRARSNGHLRLIGMLRKRLQELEKEMPVVESNEEQMAADIPQAMASPHTQLRTESSIATVHDDLGISQARDSPTLRPMLSMQSPEPSVCHGSHKTQPDRTGRDLVLNSRPLGDESYGIECLMKPIDQVIHNIDQQLNGRQDNLNTPRQVRSKVCDVPTPCECDQIVRTVSWSLPMRMHADSLVECYFLRFNRMYPVLHEQTFMRQYRQLWRTGTYPNALQPGECCGLCTQKSKGKVFRAMVYMIFASGSLFESNMLECNIARGNTYFGMAQQSIDLFDILDHQIGIEFVQLGLLFGFYLQSTERFSKCWNITGLTVRMAQNMGLHLAPQEAQARGHGKQALTQLEGEMRRRVWHGCVMLDR